MRLVRILSRPSTRPRAHRDACAIGKGGLTPALRYLVRTNALHTTAHFRASIRQLYSLTRSAETPFFSKAILPSAPTNQAVG